MERERRAGGDVEAVVAVAARVRWILPHYALSGIDQPRFDDIVRAGLREKRLPCDHARFGVCVLRRGLQAYPQALRRGHGQFRLVDHDDRLVKEIEDGRFAGMQRGHQRFPPGKGLALSGQFQTLQPGFAHVTRQFGQNRARLLKLGERLEHAFG